MKAVILLLFISLIQLQLTEGKESPQTDQATGRQAVLAPQAREVAERKQRKVKTDYKVKKGMKKDSKKKGSRKQQIIMRENENKGSKNPKSLMKEKEKKGIKKSGRFTSEVYSGFVGKRNQDTVSFVQAYKCDIFGYTRQFSVAQTKLNRADRILVNVDYLDSYKSRSSTHFNEIIAALEFVTLPTPIGYRICKGNPTIKDSITASTLLTSLKSCQMDLPANSGRCDKNIILGYSSTVMNKVRDCRDLLKKYTDAYKESIFAKSLMKYTNVCKNLGSPWNSTTGNAYDVPLEGLVVKGVNLKQLNQLGCFSDEIDALNDAIVSQLFQCRSNIVPASWGTCNNFLKKSITYVDRCGRPWPPTRISSRNANTFTFSDITNIIDHIEKLNDLSQLLEAYAGNATNFQDTLTAMNVSTEDGTTCMGVQISEQAKNIYKTLKNCSLSIPAICDISLVPNYNDIQAKIKSCSPKLEQYITQYQLSSNTSETVDEMSLLMEAFQLNSSMLIPGKNWSQWIQDLEKNITSNGDGSNSSGDKLMQLMDELVEDDCFCHTFVDVVADVDERLSMCSDVNLTGSLGNCTLTQQAAMRYVNSCRLCTVTVSTATTGRYKNYAKKNFNKMAHN